MPAAGLDAAGDSLGVGGWFLARRAYRWRGSGSRRGPIPSGPGERRGGDGTFTIGLPEEASGPVALSVHAPEAAECTWLGYHKSGGLTSWLEEAAPVAIAEGADLPVEVRLPGAVDDLCDAQKTCERDRGGAGRTTHGRNLDRSDVAVLTHRP